MWSAEHRIESHVLPHLGALFLVVHQELAIAEVLAFLLVLGGDEESPHPEAGQLAPAFVTLPESRGGFLAEGLDDLIIHRDEELGEAGVALAGASARELTVD